MWHRHQGVAAFELHTMSATSASKSFGNGSGEMVGQVSSRSPCILGPRGAERVVAIAEAVFRLASFWGIAEKSTFLQAFPATRVKVFLRDSAACSSPLLPAGFSLHLLACESLYFPITWLLKISISKKKNRSIFLPLAEGLFLNLGAPGVILGILKHTGAWVLPPEILMVGWGLGGEMFVKLLSVSQVQLRLRLNTPGVLMRRGSSPYPLPPKCSHVPGQCCQ